MPSKQKEIVLSTFYRLTKGNSYLKSSTSNFNAPAEFKTLKSLQANILNYLEENPKKYNKLKNNDWSTILEPNQLAHYKAANRKVSA
jgi:hypothetical protein